MQHVWVDGMEYCVASKRLTAEERLQCPLPTMGLEEPADCEDQGRDDGAAEVTADLAEDGNTKSCHRHQTLRKVQTTRKARHRAKP